MCVYMCTYTFQYHNRNYQEGRTDVLLLLVLYTEMLTVYMIY